MSTVNAEILCAWVEREFADLFEDKMELAVEKLMERKAEAGVEIKKEQALIEIWLGMVWSAHR